MSDNQNQELDVLEILAIMADVFQVASYIDAQNIASNSDVMKAIEVQNQFYLDEIIRLLGEISEKQDKILEELSKGE